MPAVHFDQIDDEFDHELDDEFPPDWDDEPEAAVGQKPQQNAGGPINGDRTRPRPGGLVLDPKAPMAAARTFIDRAYDKNGLRTLYCHRGDFFAWDGAHYPEISEQGIRGELYQFLEHARRPGNSDNKPYNPNRGKVSDVTDALRAVAHLPDKVCAPAWLDDGRHPPAHEMVACKNGLLHLPTLIFHPHTPAFFTNNALDFRYDAKAPTPVEWLKFLGSIFGDDVEAVETVQEIFGYCLQADTRQQKAFIIKGPKRSGKGTIGRVLTRLIGPENVAGPTLASLSSQFGLEPLVGKSVAIISDARVGRRSDQSAIAERILAITGEDTLTVDRKHRTAWTGRMATRFIILTNEIPAIADASGAFASRFIVLRLERSFYDAEDHGLIDRLLSELPSILNWSIAGWRRLHARGHFVPPASSAEAVRELEDLGSPISVFIRDRCVVGADQSVAVDRLFAAYREWCATQGRDKAGNKVGFGKDLSAAVPRLRKVRPREGADRAYFYEGIGLL